MKSILASTLTVACLLASNSLVQAASVDKRWPAPSPALSLNKHDTEMYNIAMQLGDWSWEPSTGWIQADDDTVSHGRISVDVSLWLVGPYKLEVHSLVCTRVVIPERSRRCRQCRPSDREYVSHLRGLRIGKADSRSISLQYTSSEANGTAWYWDYKQASDIPDPNNVTYPPSIYVSYKRLVVPNES
jgi:hypothetical protein